MPEVIGHNKIWPRGGHLNQKRHYELTAEEKEHVATCRGDKDGHPCKNPIFRCTECGNYGCDQEVAERCPEQGFKNSKCLNCGVTGTRLPVMEHELKSVIEEWEKEVPEIK